MQIQTTVMRGSGRPQQNAFPPHLAAKRQALLEQKDEIVEVLNELVRTEGIPQFAAALEAMTMDDGRNLARLVTAYQKAKKRNAKTEMERMAMDIGLLIVRVLKRTS